MSQRRDNWDPSQISGFGLFVLWVLNLAVLSAAVWAFDHWQKPRPGLLGVIQTVVVCIAQWYPLSTFVGLVLTGLCLQKLVTPRKAEDIIDPVSDAEIQSGDSGSAGEHAEVPADLCEPRQSPEAPSQIQWREVKLVGMDAADAGYPVGLYVLFVMGIVGGLLVLAIHNLITR